MNNVWKELGCEKVDTWTLVGSMAITMCSSTDVCESTHGDIWIDQALCTYDHVCSIAD